MGSSKVRTNFFSKRRQAKSPTIKLDDSLTRNIERKRFQIRGMKLDPVDTSFPSAPKEIWQSPKIDSYLADWPQKQIDMLRRLCFNVQVAKESRFTGFSSPRVLNNFINRSRAFSPEATKMSPSQTFTMNQSFRAPSESKKLKVKSILKKGNKRLMSL